MTDSAPLEGGCNCGAIRYVLSRAPLAVAACHCTNCRRQSGAAYSVNLVVREPDMAVTGQLTTWIDVDTQSGKPVERQFCGTCGSPIRSIVTSAPGIYAVKAGTLDAPQAHVPTLHVWLSSALPWAADMIPAGTPRFEKGTP